jgi:hypothetical protein
MVVYLEPDSVSLLETHRSPSPAPFQKHLSRGSTPCTPVAPVRRHLPRRRRSGRFLLSAGVGEGIRRPRAHSARTGPTTRGQRKTPKRPKGRARPRSAENDLASARLRGDLDSTLTVLSPSGAEAPKARRAAAGQPLAASSSSSAQPQLAQPQQAEPQAPSSPAAAAAAAPLPLAARANCAGKPAAAQRCHWSRSAHLASCCGSGRSAAAGCARQLHREGCRCVAQPLEPQRAPDQQAQESGQLAEPCGARREDGVPPATWSSLLTTSQLAAGAQAGGSADLPPAAGSVFSIRKAGPGHPLPSP